MAKQPPAPIRAPSDDEPPTSLPLHGDPEREQARLKREREARWTVVSRRRGLAAGLPRQALPRWAEASPPQEQ